MARRTTETDLAEELADIQEFAHELPDRFLHCRELGHNWRPFTAGAHPDGGYERVIRCVRCKCKRYQTLDSRGVPMGGHYEHPDGYLREGGGRIVGEGRGLLRIESIKRLIERDE